jgi:hypothetical protein
MPKCKYKNYCVFLEPNFNIITSKKDFYDKLEISFQCKDKLHINTLNIHSFGNKKSKIKDSSLFCQVCKDENDNLLHTQKFIKDVVEKTGHSIIDVNFSTRKINYKCGNCNSINKSFTQNFDIFTTRFCNKCQNNKRITDTEYRKSIIQKYEATCMERYGVRNVSQDPVIFDKIVKKSYTVKKYKFPSGKVVRIQGYEGFAIDDLLSENIAEDDLVFTKDIPTFSYMDDNDTQHVYHPDIFVKSLNLIVEVKSDYTYTKELRKNYLKFCKVIESGYRLRVMIYNDKFKSVKDIIIQSVNELLTNFLDQ